MFFRLKFMCTDPENTLPEETSKCFKNSLKIILCLQAQSIKAMGWKRNCLNRARVGNLPTLCFKFCYILYPWHNINITWRLQLDSGSNSVVSFWGFCTVCSTVCVLTSQRARGHGLYFFVYCFLHKALVWKPNGFGKTLVVIPLSWLWLPVRTHADKMFISP